MGGYLLGSILGSMVVPIIGMILIYNTSKNKILAAVGFATAAFLALVPVFFEDIERLYTFTTMLIAIGCITAFGIIQSNRIQKEKMRQQANSSPPVEETQSKRVEVTRKAPVESNPTISVLDTEKTTVADVIYCGRCGRKNPLEYHFCFNCGQQLRITGRK